MKQRPGESQEAYAARLAEIEAIVEGFRWSRFAGKEAEEREARLSELTAEVPPR